MTTDKPQPMGEMLDLLPCPFCGQTPVWGEREVGIEGSPANYMQGYVECANGECDVMPEVTDTALIFCVRHWNTRTRPDQPSDESRARAALDPDMPMQELLLHMGELSKDEILVARAAIAWANEAGR